MRSFALYVRRIVSRHRTRILLCDGQNKRQSGCVLRLQCRRSAVWKGRTYRIDLALRFQSTGWRRLFFVNQTVKCFLHFLRACVQFIEKQHIGFFSGNYFWWEKFRGITLNLWNADNILRSQLASKQRDAHKTDVFGEPLHQCGFSNTGRAPDKDRPYRCDR